VAGSGNEGSLSSSGIPVSDRLDCLKLKVEPGLPLLAIINQRKQEMSPSSHKA
jgi:hypothetical protein